MLHKMAGKSLQGGEDGGDELLQWEHLKLNSWTVERPRDGGSFYNIMATIEHNVCHDDNDDEGLRENWRMY